MKKQVLSETDFEVGIKALKKFLEESDEETSFAKGIDSNRLSSEFELAKYKGEETAHNFVLKLLDKMDKDQSNPYLSPDELVKLLKIVPKSWHKYLSEDTFAMLIPENDWPAFKSEEWVKKHSKSLSASLKKRIWAEYNKILSTLGVEDTAEGVKITTKELPVTQKNIDRVRNILSILRDSLKRDVRGSGKVDEKRANYYFDKFSEIGRLLAPKEYISHKPTFGSTLKFKRKS